MTDQPGCSSLEPVASYNNVCVCRCVCVCVCVCGKILCVKGGGMGSQVIRRPCLLGSNMSCNVQGNCGMTLISRFMVMWHCAAGDC